jgi:hypothetical protein
MTSNGISSGAVQVAGAIPPEKIAEQAAPRKEEHPESREIEKTPEVAEPMEMPAQVYDQTGKVVASPSGTSIDMMA